MIKLDPNIVLVKSIPSESREIDKEVVFTRADKGKTVIAIDKVDYISETNRFCTSFFEKFRFNNGQLLMSS